MAGKCRPDAIAFKEFPYFGDRDALRRVDELLRSGKHWVLDADLKSYFDTIPHERLMERVAEKVADGKVLSLIEGMLQAGVMDTVEGWQATKQGSLQGAVISPLLSNIYLNGLDWKMARKGFEMVRYADDFVVLCASQQEAQKALEEISHWIEENGLKLHPTKTRIVDASQRGGFDFLGYHFERGKKWPRKKSLDKLKDAVRSKTRRNNGRCMKAICADLNLNRIACAFLAPSGRTVYFGLPRVNPGLSFLAPSGRSLRPYNRR
jgi:RNA-directed DNA polymerase